METKFKPGDTVYAEFEIGGARCWCKYILIGLHDELGGTATLQNGVGRATCRISELRTRAERDAIVLEEEAPEARRRLEPVITAWDSGLKTFKEIATSTGKTPAAVAAQLREAHRRGFIELPEDLLKSKNEKDERQTNNSSNDSGS